MRCFNFHAFVASLTLAASFVTVVALLGANSSYGFTPTLLPQEQDQAARLRRAGNDADHTKIPALLVALKEKNPIFQKTALHALAQMGATDALPQIDALVTNAGDQSVVNFAVVERARLLAEKNADSSIGGGGSSKKTLLMQQLNLTDSRLNETAVSYQAKPNHEQEPTPQEVYALREISDIMYHDSYPGSRSLLEIANLSFAQDPPSALKVRLSPLSPKERVVVLVHELAEGQVSPALNNYEMQLAVDEGTAANQAVDAELQRMDTQTRQKNIAGYAALFRVLGGIGDTAQAPTVAQYLHDPNGEIGYFARQVYDGLKAGLKTQYAPGY